MDYKMLGARIKQVRLNKGLTQEKLSEMCGLSLTYLGVIENGHKKLSVRTLVKIARVLDVSTDYLLSDSLKISLESTIQEMVPGANNLSKKDLDMVIDVVKTMLSHIQKDK